MYPKLLLEQPETIVSEFFRYLTMFLDVDEISTITKQIQNLKDYVRVTITIQGIGDFQVTKYQEKGENRYLINFDFKITFTIVRRPT